MTVQVTAGSLVPGQPHPTDEELLIYDAAPSTRDIPIALMGAYWSFAHLFRILLPEPRRTNVVEHYRAGMPTFFRPSTTPPEPIAATDEPLDR